MTRRLFLSVLAAIGFIPVKAAASMRGPHKILVARMDDTTESGFVRGAITPKRGVPLTRNFDREEPPLGRCDLEVDGDSVYAVIDDGVARRAAGLYPAVGFRASVSSVYEDRHLHADCDVLEVSLCDLRNADPQIPPIS